MCTRLYCCNPGGPGFVGLRLPLLVLPFRRFRGEEVLLVGELLLGPVRFPLGDDGCLLLLVAAFGDGPLRCGESVRCCCCCGLGLGLPGFLNEGSGGRRLFLRREELDPLGNSGDCTFRGEGFFLVPTVGGVFF